jgi:zinc protease
MHSLRLFLYLFVIYISLAPSIQAKLQTRTDELSHDQIVETTLKNGLRVCLKKSDLEPGEFDFQLFAVGGFAHLPVADQPSAWLATEIAWESGLDQLTGDELECALDDHSLEMSINLNSFDRQIQAAGPTSELIYCLRLTKLFFTDPQFDEEGLKEALNHARRRLQHKGKMGQVFDEETALKINLRNWSVISPFHALDLAKIELPKAKASFKHFFSNPAEFALVIVGDFEPQKIIPLLEESLGSLPASPVISRGELTSPSFPTGITKKEFVGITRYRQGLTRLTFPLSLQTIDPLALDLLCSILKRELTAHSILGQLEKTCFNVSYSFPLFPYMQPCWLVMKFSCSTPHIHSVCQEILKKMEAIQQEGISEELIRFAIQEWADKRNQISNNSYVLSLLSDYYRAGWDIRQLYPSPDHTLQEKEMVKKVLDCYPNLNQYSMISLHP